MRVDRDRLRRLFREAAHLSFLIHYGILGAKYGADGIALTDRETDLISQFGLCAECLQRLANTLATLPGKNLAFDKAMKSGLVESSFINLFLLHSKADDDAA